MFLNYQPKQMQTALMQQRGGALPVAIFVIVVMSILGVAMIRVLGDLGRATVSDVYGARAYAAARSGAEVFLTELFPLDSSSATSALCAPRGDPPLAYPVDFNTSGLTSCSAEVICDRLELPAPYAGTHFRITSQGSCDAGNMLYSKEIILEAADGVY